MGKHLARAKVMGSTPISSCIVNFLQTKQQVCLPEALIRAHAGVVELADTPDLGSGIERCEGSNPFTGTINITP